MLDHFCEKMEFDNESTYLKDLTTLVVLPISRRYIISMTIGNYF